MSKKIETNLSEEYFQKSKKLQVLKDRKELIDGLPHLYGQSFYKWSREFFDSTNQYTFLAAANQIGKAELLDQLIPTPNGFVLFGDLKVGDEVFGDDGKPCVVTDIPWQGEDEFYEVEFSDGTFIKVGSNHLWRCKTYKERFRKNYTPSKLTIDRSLKPNKSYGDWIELSTKELVNICGYNPETTQTKRAVIPFCKPIEYPHKDLFDPYALGLILGDGYVTNTGYISLNKPDEFILNYLIGLGLKRGKRSHVVMGNIGVPPELYGKRSFEKFIPKEYLTVSFDQRLALLRGLMDTDGTVNKDGDVTEFDSTSEAIANGVRELVFSLGGTSKIFFRPINKFQNGLGRPSWRLRIKMPPGINPFLSPVKASKWRGDIRYKHERVIYKITPIGKRKAKCISVSSDNSCYVSGKNYVVTHNSSIQIRKVIHLATEPSIWPKLWKSRPLTFWYLYPTKELSTIEFHKKWVPEFLPRGKFKDHPIYGWKIEERTKYIHAIHFNSGVSIFFRTYATDVQHLQAGTVWYMACFAGDTDVLTPSGLKRIDSIKVGDIVSTHNGPKRVTKVYESINDTCTGMSSNGLSVEATLDHPFLSNYNWVKFGTLHGEDKCHTVPGWKILKRLSFLKETFTTDTQNLTTKEKGITSDMGVSNSMLNFGKNIIKKMFLKILSFTISTLIHLTTRLVTFSLSLERNIQEYTSLRSGDLRENTSSSVKSVELYSKQDLASGSLKDSVLLNVNDLHGLKRLHVFGVATKKWLGRTLHRFFVQKFVQIEQLEKKKKQKVYNLETEDSHTYYANGFLVHNCDEELPVEIFDELNMRIAATDGYFSMVFTATIGQEFWRRTIEERGRNEKFKGAKKIQVSMYDCLEFEDGSPSHWTLERIKRIENSCKSEVEIQKRVHGRFIKDSGLKYSGFTRQINVKPPHHLPPGWHIYAGVDIGSGGEQGHPSAIVFVAVSPDYKQGRVFKGWRGDGIQTTASDVVSKFIELKGGLITTGQFYDWSSKDFETIARRMGEPFTPAEKSHEIGEQVINVLFKNEMLAIYDLPELQGLMEELSSLDVKTKKTHATDDFIDALRYCVTKIPWDWGAINSEEKVSSKSSLSYEEIGRRGLTLSEDPDLSIMINDEMDAWSELYDV